MTSTSTCTVKHDLACDAPLSDEAVIITLSAHGIEVKVEEETGAIMAWEESTTTNRRTNQTTDSSCWVEVVPTVHALAEFLNY